MEIIQGKTTRQMSSAELALQVGGFETVLIDLGTGDGRFALQSARANPRRLVVGIDACRENLVETSRSAPKNALFVIAGAQDLPEELRGLAGQLTINFPWGSLLSGLLDGDAQLLDSLHEVTCPGAALEVRLNASALAEAGWALEEGAERAAEVLEASGFRLRAPLRLGPADLRAIPTTWAKRLAYGRDPRAFYLAGRKQQVTWAAPDQVDRPSHVPVSRLTG